METTYAIPAIPDWLIEEQPTKQRRSKEMLELANKQYEIAFEYALEKIAAGITLTDAMREYHQQIDVPKFRQWIQSNKDRKERQDKAKALGMEALEDELVRIADGATDPTSLPEDVQRSKLRIETRLRVMGFNNRKYKDKQESGNPFAGGINIVIAGVESPYKTVTAAPTNVIEHNPHE